MEYYSTSTATGREYTPQVIYARNIKDKLSEKIIGSIKTYLYEDCMYITIYATNHIIFKYTMNNISDAIVQGVTSEMVAHKVYKRYTQYIKNLFFL